MPPSDKAVDLHQGANPVTGFDISILFYSHLFLNYIYFIDGGVNANMYESAKNKCFDEHNFLFWTTLEMKFESTMIDKLT